MWERAAVSMIGEYKALLFDQVTTITGMYSSRIVLSETSVDSLESTSAKWGLIPALWVISKSFFINRRLQRASLPVISAGLCIHRISWWSVRNVNLLPPMRGCNNKMCQTTVRHSQCVFFRFLSRSERFRDRYPIRRDDFPSFWSCRRTIRTCLSHASVYKYIFRSSFAGKVPFLRSLYLNPDARLLQKLADLFSVFYQIVFIQVTRFSRSFVQIFCTSCIALRIIFVQWLWLVFWVPGLRLQYGWRFWVGQAGWFGQNNEFYL